MKDAFKPGVRVKAKAPLEKAPWAERAYIKHYDREGFYVVERPGKSDFIVHEDDIELAEEDVDLTGVIDLATFKLLLEAMQKGEAFERYELNGAQVETRVTRDGGELKIDRTITLQKPVEYIRLRTIV